MGVDMTERISMVAVRDEDLVERVCAGDVVTSDANQC